MRKAIWTLLLVMLTPVIWATDASEPVILGEISVAELLEQRSEFDRQRGRYKPSRSAVKTLSRIEQDVEIRVFFGTWCHDSEREVPRLIKILEQADNSHLSLSLIGLDREKADPEGLAQAQDIRYTPTMVVMVDGQETGRIVERPKRTLEKDLLGLLRDLGDANPSPRD